MRIAAAAVILVTLAASSFAAPIFYDDFQSYVNETYYNSGTPHTFQTAPGKTPSGNIWTVTRNSVDVHGPEWVDWLCGPGNNCVDLNGSYSTYLSGEVRTTVNVPTPGWYVLSFYLAGSHRYAPEVNPALNDSLEGYNTAQVVFGNWSQSYTLGPNEPWQTIISPALYLSGPTTLIFRDATYVPGSNPPVLVNDPMGLLLDNVSVNLATPEPASFVLLVFGAGLIAFRRRRAV